MAPSPQFPSRGSQRPLSWLTCSAPPPTAWSPTAPSQGTCRWCKGGLPRPDPNHSGQTGAAPRRQVLALLVLRTHFEFSSRKLSPLGLEGPQTHDLPSPSPGALRQPDPARSLHLGPPALRSSTPAAEAPKPTPSLRVLQAPVRFSNPPLTWRPEASQGHVQNDLILSLPDTLPHKHQQRLQIQHRSASILSLPRSIVKAPQLVPIPGWPGPSSAPLWMLHGETALSFSPAHRSTAWVSSGTPPSPSRVEDACVLTSVMFLHSLSLHGADKQHVTGSA